MKKTVPAILALTLISAAVHAGPQKLSRPTPVETAPAALQAQAIATRSDSSGMIGSARIPGTNSYIVYMRTQRGCGSAGCRPQIWSRSGNNWTKDVVLAGGQLPVVILPTHTKGMPDIGITIRSRTGQSVIMPIKFSGTTYSEEWSPIELPANSGTPLITESSLRPFQR